MRKNFLRQKIIDRKEVLDYQLIKSVTNYPQELLLISSNFRFLLLRVFRTERWEVALACGCEKIYERLAPEKNLLFLLASFRVALNSNFPHILNYLKPSFDNLNYEDKNLLLNDILNLPSYNWNNVNIFTIYFNLPLYYCKQLSIKAAIICKNSWYFSLIDKSFFTPNLRKLVIEKNCDIIYRNFSVAANLLADWSLAIKFRSYRIIDCLKFIIFRGYLLPPISENKFRQAIYLTHFSCYYLEIFFISFPENKRMLINYCYSKNRRISALEKKLIFRLLSKLN